MRRYTTVAVLFLSGTVACGGDDDSSSTSSTSSSSGAASSSSGSTTSSSGTTTSSGGSSGGGSSGATSSSGSTTTNADVTGVWIGTVGSKGTYLDLAQTGTTVTGEACDAPGKSCFKIEGGAVAGDQLTAKYATGTDDVTMRLTVASDGKTMQGKYAYTKCACSENAALGKK